MTAEAREVGDAWCCVRSTEYGTTTDFFDDDPLNDDGSRPDGWRSAEDKARAAAVEAS